MINFMIQKASKSEGKRRNQCLDLVKKEGNGEKKTDIKQLFMVLNQRDEEESENKELAELLSV